MLKSYIRSCRLDLSLTSLILLPPICTLRARDVYLQSIGYQVLYASFFPLLPSPKENIWCISKYILNYILKSYIRSCNAPGSPRSGMSIVKVLKTYNDFQCWNQLSGLATHHAHPPLTPITCTDPFMSIVEIRSCKPFTVLLFRILGLVDLSLTGFVNLLLNCFSMLKSYIRSCRSITHSLKSGLVNLFNVGIIY